MRNRAKYDLAAERLASGVWTADVEAGVLYGTAGRPIGYVMDQGYLHVAVYVAGKVSRMYAHGVLWEYANGPVPDEMQINHVDGCKTNNRAVNLELVTAAQNIQHAYRTGLAVGLHGPSNPRAKVTTEAVKALRKRREDSGLSFERLGAEFGISREHARRIVVGTRRAIS